ncbi:Calx-beta domain-containing protein [Thalassoroseus pseudoceratinae]|uniref:Calx-beta domain-containing protein n=1 Tax=Thalassoroseus pseudoceratinae TaxID=2713176 RepID=UPI00141F63DC|nr:Calx-beta domain-containing protein [Thalassoroseus pseudoceratinae]
MYLRHWLEQLAQSSFGRVHRLRQSSQRLIRRHPVSNSLPNAVEVFEDRTLLSAVAVGSFEGSLNGEVAAPLEQTASNNDIQLEFTEDTGWGEHHYVSSNFGSDPFSGIDVNALIGADTFYDAGFTGSNAIVANVEAGHVWNQHETLGGVTTLVQETNNAGPQTGDVDKHATWAGQLIAGESFDLSDGREYQRGVAYGAEMFSGSIATQWNGSPYSLSFSFNTSTFIAPYRDFMVTGAGPLNQTVDVINSSWGNSDTTGAAFGTFSRGIDALVNQSGKTVVFSAGNSGPGANTVGGPAAGYNVISVGALGSDTDNPPYQTVSSFSSRGANDLFIPNDPTSQSGTTLSEVRSTVDIVAPGQNITAALYGGATGGNIGGTDNPQSNFYSFNIAGTSFAAPTVAGGATLIADAARTVLGTSTNALDGRVNKAILLNSADKIPGWDNAQSDVNGVITTTQSLDLDSGAGAMNLTTAFDQLLLGTTDLPGLGGGTVDVIGWDYGAVGQAASTDYIIGDFLEGGTEFTATLSWFVDRSINLGNNSSTEDSFDDLDLEVWEVVNGTPTTKVAESISDYNTVEHLNFTVPATGQYMIRTVWDEEHWDFVADTNTELYGLAWSGTAAMIVDDHGDNAIEASSVNAATTTAGELEISGDQDYFSFNAQAGTEYTLSTTLLTLPDSTLTLYDTDGVTELEFDDDGGTGLASEIVWTAPADGIYFAAVQAEDNVSTGTFEFNLDAVTNLSGVVWDDVNGDGVFDADENPLIGWEVYLDTNDNGVLDGGEQTQTTLSDGSYIFTDLPSDTYTVRTVLQAGYERTSPVSTSPVSTVVWEPLGPGPSLFGQVENIAGGDAVVGAIHTAAAHPTNPDILYIGSTNGGIWRTTNATDPSPDWTPLIDDQESLSIGALEFDPTDPTGNTLVAGIGRFSSFGRIGGERTGLLRTTDGGDTWTSLDGGGLLDGKNISGVAARGNTIVVSVNVADAFTFGNVGIFRSVDGGATFTQIAVGDGSGTGLPGGVSYDLAADPTDYSVLYTSVAFSGIVSGQVGVYRSTDTGATWTKVSNSTMDALIEDGSNGTGTSNLEIAVGNSGEVYAAIINTGDLAGFFRSGDGGSTWVAMDIPSTNENGTDVGLNPRGIKGPDASAAPSEIAGGQGSIHFSLRPDPTDSNIVYAGGDRQPRTFGDAGTFPNSIGATDFTGRLFRGDFSQPSGSQWVHLTHSNTLGAAGGGTASSSAPHADSREIVFSANGDLIEVDDGGVYRRTDPRSNTGDWFSLNGNLQVTEAHDVAWDSVSDIAMTGNQDTGTTQQESTGSFTWVSVSTADGGDVAIDDTSTPGRSFRYSSFQNLGAFRRREYDANNNLLDETFLPGISDVQFVTPVVLNAVDATRLVIGGSGTIYESLNQGSSNTAVPGSTGVNAFDGKPLVYGHITNPDLIVAGDGSTVSIRTGAPGSSMATTTTAFPGGTVRDIVLDPTIANTFFVADSDQVFMTTDLGGNWTEVTGNLAGISGVDFHDVEYIEGPATDLLVVGTGEGVFYSTAITGFTVWSELSTDLPTVDVFDMEYDAADDVLVVGTLGRGAWILRNVSTTFGVSTKTPEDGFWTVDLVDGNSIAEVDFGSRLIELPEITITVSPDSVLEDGVTNLEYTFTRSGVNTQPLTIDFSVGGDAVFGNDYTQTGAATFADSLGSVTFAAGVSTVTVTIDPTAELAVESNEDVVLTLLPGTNYTVATPSAATGTIENDDTATITITELNADRDERNSGITSYTFSVTLDGEVEGGFDLAYSTQDDSATVADQDYVAQTGTLNFAGTANESQTLSVLVRGDTDVETDEVFQVILGAISGLNPGFDPADISIANGGMAEGTIVNDDSATLSFAAVSASKDEGDADTTEFTFEVTLEQAVNGGFNVAYTTDDGTATIADGDYVDNDGTLTFVGNEGEVQTITVEVNGDLTVEADEMFQVALGMLSGFSGGISANSVVVVDGTQTGTILNDDIGRLTIDDISQNEDDGPMTFTVSLDRFADQDVTVRYATFFGTADTDDFTTANGSVTIAAGSNSATFDIGITADTIVELDQEFEVQLSNVDAAGRDVIIGDGRGVGTIVNDDAALISIADVAANEDDGTITFTISLDQAADADVSVDFATSPDTADLNDVPSQSGTATIVAGALSTMVTLDLTPDQVVELDERFFVDLSNAQSSGRNVSIGDSQGIGTILNDDTANLIIGDATQFENDPNTISFSVSLNRIADADVTIDFTTQPDSADNTDFTASTGTATIAAGQSSTTIEIEILDDDIVELHEQFFVQLSNVQADGRDIVVADNQGLGTIVNDDTARISIDDVSIFERTAGVQELNFTVTLDKAVDNAVSVEFSTADKFAEVADNDYQASSGTLDFVGLAGETQTITIAVNSDTKFEADESFVLDLLDVQSNGRSVVISDAQGEGTILNDDLRSNLATLRSNSIPATSINGNDFTEFFSGNFDGIPASLETEDDLFFWNPTTGANRLIFGNGTLQDNPFPVSALNGNDFTEVLIGDFDEDGSHDLFFWNPVTGRNRLLHTTVATNDLGAGFETNVIPSTAINGNDFTSAVVGNFDGGGPDDLFFWNPVTGRNRLTHFVTESVGSDTGLIGIQTNVVDTTLINADFESLHVGQFEEGGLDEIVFLNLETGKNRRISFAIDTPGQSTVMDGFVDSLNAQSGFNGSMFQSVVVADLNGDGLDDIFLWNSVTGENRTALTDIRKSASPVFVDNVFRPQSINNEFSRVIRLVDDVFTEAGADDLFFWNPTTGSNRTGGI